MDRTQWLALEQQEAARPQGQNLSELTPSVRDFSLYVSTQRQELAVIARVQRADADGGRRWPTRDLADYAVACDDAEVAALAVATDRQHGGSLTLMRSIAERTQAPLLHDDLTWHPSQLHDARLHGADAAIFPAAHLDAATLAELTRIASSLHMASVIAVESSAELAKALAVGKTLIGIDADVAATIRLAGDVPSQRTVIALRDPGVAEAIRALHGHVDAVIVGALLLDSDDLAASLAALTA